MEINKYQNGKIYTIRSPSTDKFYIGSTIEKYISNRFSKHKNKYKDYLEGKYHYMSSFDVIKLDNSYLELLELCPCNSKAELERREGQLIREHKLLCVNKNIAAQTKKEYRVNNAHHIKEYRDNNKEHAKIQHICECGSTYSNHHKSTHLKTIKHTTFIQNKV